MGSAIALKQLIAFLAANKVVILGALLALSELLALIPGVAANSIYQLIVNTLKRALGRK